jgi:lipopolysaccharide export system protein LptA
VVVTSNDSGTQMTTNTLDWNRNKDLVSTQDPVQITDDQGVITGQGMSAHPNLKKAQINKHVKAKVHTQPQGEPDDQVITVTSDGPMQMNQATQYAVFNTHVIAIEASTGRELHCDKMEIWFNQVTKKIKQAICTGHVKAVQGPDVSYADKMIYDGETQLLTMIGRPKIIFITGGAQGKGLFQPLGK